MMTIGIDGETIVEVNEFLDADYIFGRDRVRRIWKKSRLSVKAFAAAHSFSYSELRGWLTERKKGHSNNPCPASRVRLAFIEASLRKKKR